ncbi:MAG TPA: sulfite exporter TauE/SafE family protein [Gaiellaceae bacterium]|nr:sulfite exporter TauE/SafE family protein [Gaiellaceae bacterium]
MAIFVAGVAAGVVNAVVGSGTLITFPVLLAVGYPAVIANVSNAVGLVPGLLAGAIGYRSELRGQRRLLVMFGAVSFAGGLLGALLLLALPASAFRAIVPVFIGLAVALILVQPYVRRFAADQARTPSGRASALILGALLLCGVYGGYFGAAQGILLLAILGFAIPHDMQVANAVKNVLNLITNLVAATVFVAVADVAWRAALLVALGSVVGGAVGARVGRRLRPGALRVLVVAVGTVALVRLAAA